MKDKRIRVLYTITNFNTAGSGKVVYDLVNGLDASKFDVEIACEDDTGPYFKIIEALGYPIHIFDTKVAYKPYYNLFLRIWKIAQFYKKREYDIVHSWQWSSDWTEALAARMAGVKWLFTKKAMGFQNKHWYIKSYLAHFIITINTDMRDCFPNKKQQALIPLGIDIAYYNSDLFQDYTGETDQGFQIITVANLVPVKEIQILIHAIYELQDPAVKLRIIGDDTTAYGLKMKALKDELGLQNQVLFLGKQLDVRPYIVHSDLFVITSKQEGMPMALVEAMSMGIPVIGSDVAGVNYVLRDFSNLLFKASDVNALALKITEIKSLNREARLELGHNLRHYCEINFSIGIFLKAHENLYLDLLK